MNDDIHLLTAVAEQAAIKTGAFLRKAYAGVVEKKSKTSFHDIVTVCDTQSEEFIFSILKNAFPSHAFLGEETGMKENYANKITWIVDPIDGTINFVRKIPFFSVSIAATLNNEVLCGVVYNPITEERFVAKKGFGATLNGEAIHVSKTDQIEQGIYAIGFPYIINAISSKNIDLYFKILKHGAPIRNLGSGALSLAYTAAGKLDGFWIPSLYTWDMSAGMLLLKEAGGKITRQNGEDFGTIATHKPFDILATNGLLHDEILNELK